MAFNAVEEVFATFPWLRELGNEVYQLIVDGVTNADPSAVITQSIRESEVYKTRFAGLIQRQANDLPAISEADYLQVERGYLQQIRAFNVQGTLGLTDTEAFREFSADLIGKDVSTTELNTRLTDHNTLLTDSSEFVQQAFEDFYGVRVSEHVLLTYFLDPDRGMELITDQLATAQVGGAAFRFGLNVSAARAEILRKEGVSADLARQGFANIAREEPVLSRLAQIHNVTPLNQQELEEFFFHDDPEIAGRRARTFQTALTSFQGGGARNVSRSGGLGELVDPNRTA